MRSGFLHWEVEQLQIRESLLLLKLQHYCGAWRPQTCNVLAATKEANVKIFRYGCLRSSSIFWNTFINFRLFQSRLTLTFLPEIARRLSGPNFRQLSPDFLTQRFMVLLLTAFVTGTAVEFRFKCYFLHQELNNYTLLDVLWQDWKRVIHCELNTMQIFLFAAVYSTESWSLRNNKNVGIISVSGSHRKRDIFAEVLLSKRPSSEWWFDIR